MPGLEQPVRNSAEKYLERATYEFSTRARGRVCTNCSVHKSIDNPAGNRAVFPEPTSYVRAEIYVHSLEIAAAVEGTTTYNAICFNYKKSCLYRWNKIRVIITVWKNLHDRSSPRIYASQR